LLKVGQRKTNRWFWLSAIALGAAAAGKYSYIPVTVVVLAYLLLFEKKTRWYWLLVYTSVAMVVFFVLDVSLWRDPFERLYQSLTFHMQYSQGEHVQQSGYPWYQPFTWIFTSSPAQWHPQVFFYFGFDGLISLLALPGIRREWKARRWLVVWLAAGALFLLAWPTKWPQYALTVTPPLCIMASATLRRFHHWARETENYWEYLSEMLPKPQKWFWWVVGALLLFVGGLYLTASIQRAVGRIGWSHLTPANSFLPGATVYDLQALPDGRMLIAASSGAALWSAPQATDETGQWTVYDHTNSGLPDSQVLSLGYVPEGGYWFGTASGAAFYDGETWLAYGADELGLGDGRVLSLAVSADGSVYAGTMSGASAWDGAAWTPIPQLAGQTVFALTLDSSSLWAGASGGAGRLSLQDGDWEFHPTESAVHDILVDPSGAVWAATSGSGLARLDGETWAYFRTGNSGLPYSMVNCLAQVGAGIWVGAASPANAGGLLAVMEGDSWSTFLSTNSGVSGSEPLVIVQSENGQVWIGTRTQGIDIYQPGR